MGVGIRFLIGYGEVRLYDGREIATQRRLSTPESLGIIGGRLGVITHSGPAHEFGTHRRALSGADDAISRAVYVIGAGRRDRRSQWRREPSRLVEDDGTSEGAFAVYQRQLENWLGHIALG